MNVSYTNNDTVSGELKIEVEKKDYAEQAEKSLRKLRQKVNMPGFRQGMVPMGIVKKLYAKQVEFEELNKIVSEKTESYVKENNLRLIGEILPSEKQESFDIENDDPITFRFDIALEPPLDICLTKEDSLTRYQVKISDKEVNEEIDYIQSSYGSFDEIDKAETENDCLMGVVKELENDELKPEGVSDGNAFLALERFAGKTERKKFIGACKGDKIIFNPYKAYKGDEKMIAMLLNIDKDRAKEMKSDFEFEVDRISRRNKAELDQALFDRVFGEGGVKDETEFRERIKKDLAQHYAPACDKIFRKDMRSLMLGKAADIKLADDILKRWFVMSERVASDKIDADYPDLKASIIYRIAIQQLTEKYEITVEREDLAAFASQIIIERYMQYGMLDRLTKEELDNQVSRVLQQQKDVLALLQVVQEMKIAERLKDEITVVEQEITPEEFKNIQNKEIEISDERI